MTESRTPAGPRSQPGPFLPSLAIRWAWAMIPLAWGVWQTVRTSLALFR